jgi:hypothetical protein
MHQTLLQLEDSSFASESGVLEELYEVDCFKQERVAANPVPAKQ